MRRPRIKGSRVLRLALSLAALLAAALLLLGLTGGLHGLGAPSSASAQTAPGEPTAQTDDSLPARDVMMLGSSPTEASGETWGIGEVGGLNSSSYSIVRYSSDSGWSLASSLDRTGNALQQFEPDHTPLAGSITSGGDGALLGTLPQAGSRRQVLLVRNPGGAFREVQGPPVEGEAALKTGEELFATSRAPMLAALDEGGHAGVLVVPINRAASGVEDRVLHWDGESWKSEPIELPQQSEEAGGFRVLAIGASSPANAWLLAQLSGSSNAVALFRRHEGRWLQAGPAPLTARGLPFRVGGTGEPPTAAAQTLTVSDEGVWIDGERTDAAVPVTMYFKPGGEEGLGGEVLASWCNVSESFPACTGTLPGSLPAGHSRSFAWANPSTPYGERVITGLGEGVTLRLDGGSFTRVPSLGGSEPPNDVGGTLGAAFSGAREGWLGNEALPVHLTLNPAPNRLASYPVPFRHALTAIAPQPGSSVGALSSQALAVGDQGEVARYQPGEGWQPESLLSSGGRFESPPLRAVAWPTPQRAYAVGTLDHQGDSQMWLWRGETGLWEPDPATPVNFRGNLLGVAFDPSNPSRGYAVGQQGVLLRFGKTWTQEALPSEVQGASFTSIAFAGSEAIVAFRQLHVEGGSAHYSGGLLVNEGSGWHVDQQAAAALGNAIPWAVAGLADGGAALSATPGGLAEAPLILERNSPGAAWAQTPPYPGFEGPGSLALFREGGALRAVGSGGIPNTMQVDNQREPPAGFPPTLISAYPIATGYVVRQTAGGWSDEEHERNHAEDPLGEYKSYDAVYQPDPTSAVLIDPSGAQGWAVGGAVDESLNGALDTADVARYPADGVPAPGVGSAPVQTNASEASFAIGGGAQCLAPCADRTNARIGPDLWLSSAIEQAHQIAGVRAFLYTGPHVTSGNGHGIFPVPYQREFANYASRLANSLPAFAAVSPSDLGPGSECPFQEAFAAFPAPFGNGTNAAGLTPVGRGPACATYYSLESSGSGGTVRVIVLDDAGSVDATQRAWLVGQLQEAASVQQPAIVLGNADLNAEIAAGEGAAAEVAQILVSAGASAYFYDAPEENVMATLRVGSGSIPTFGSGTLGYVSSVKAQEQNFIGHSGFLLAEVNVAARNANNVAPVTPRLIPNVGELALEAQDGVLLHRSQPALFDALARRPRAGGRAARGSLVDESDPYIPIPANCVGAQCASGIFPEYTFSSSRPDVGDFVEPNLAVSDKRAVLLENEKPIPDSKSGLFCAYNAGKTVVTISAGGLSSSLTVTVQAGSVRRPCGTQPLKEAAASQQGVPVPPPAPAPAPAPAGPTPSSSPAPLPVPPAPPPVPVPAPVSPKPVLKAPPFFVPAALPATLLPFVPLPVPTPARPTPPSGTSAVTSPVEAAEKEEEHEEATESVSNSAVAYRAPDHEPSPVYVLGIVLLAAIAGVSLRRTRSGRRGVQVAPATISTMRTQRRLGDGRRPRR